jgi:BsuBI/PstI restriction endonuclease domain
LKLTHSRLIQAEVIELHATVLRDYRLIFIDDSDEEHIKNNWEKELAKRGLLLDLSSLWPDTMLVNDPERERWYVDPVATDGEIDETRRRELSEWARARVYQVRGYTTAYATWSSAGAPQ